MFDKAARDEARVPRGLWPKAKSVARRLPFADAQRLVAAHTRPEERAAPWRALSPDVEAVRQ